MRATPQQRLTQTAIRRAEQGAPWLLKLHGDVTGGHMILTEREFLGYDNQWRPLASIVQAAMISQSRVV